MRWGFTFVLLCSFVVGTPPSQASPVCSDRSWVAGTVDICAGELVYRDYVYDDYGADTGALFASNTGGLSQPAGDMRYAMNVNSADLLALRMRAEGDRLHVVFEMNSLFAPDDTTAAVAIDTDGDPSTGGGTWPGLGVSSSGWDAVYTFSTGDPATNTLVGDVPLPPASSWTVQAVTAIADGPVMNVAFRGPKETGTWWENTQSAALRTGDISAFGYEVSTADLTAGVTRLADPGTGLFERVYTSAYTIPPGEGVDYAGVPGKGTDGTFGQYFHFLGTHQPYGFYVPARPGPHGLQFALHGYSANHSSLIGQRGFQQRLGEELNRILVVPLGRGPAGFYSSWSERDVLDVLDDVLTNYDVDRDSLFMGGYSMGGYGTLRFATLYPDLWAGYINWVGFDGDCFRPVTEGCEVGGVGKPIDFLGNLLHVPGASLYSGADELVWVNQAVAMMDALAASQAEHALYLHPAAEHLTYAILDDWRKEAAYTKDRTLAHDPGHIQFRYDASLDALDLGVAHDRAYWLSSIRARGAGMADVEAWSFGCGTDVEMTNIGRGAGVDPVPWVSQVGEHHRLQRVDGPESVLSLRNVSSLTVDTVRACLDGSFAYHVSTDGPVVIAFSDGRTLSFSRDGTFEGVL
jgi:pimeloyl-ACP methyl ester carboxylesterase